LRTLALTLPLALSLAVSVGATVAVGAAPIDGTWSGGGYVKPTDGKRERVSCRVTYRRQTPKVFSVSAVCASTSTQIRQSGEVLKVTANTYVGDLFNSEYNISGRVRIRVKGRRQSVSFRSSSGSGSMTLRKR
jgi:hypothetical protein